MVAHVAGIRFVMAHLDRLDVKENNMKTRQEMVYDFMVALSSNPEYLVSMFHDPTDSVVSGKDVAYVIRYQAEKMADEYLESLS